MIPRYTRAPMASIWSPANRYRIWYEIEAHACDAQAELGTIPAEAATAVWQVKNTEFDIERIEALDREVRHDVIAFLTHLGELVGPMSRYVHHGMTSSDVLDTGFAVQLSRATDLLLDDLDQVLAALRRRAHEHKHTICIGRSHGIHAEPTTFGLKLAQAYAEMQRNRQRLQAARAEIAVCAISGAVGTFAHLSPAVEKHVAGQLGLTAESISSQVIPRDRHAMYFSVLAIIASSIERLATEIRHLQRTEVGEAEEYFAPEQKGSSAMPHKRNPVLSENLTGLARLVRMTVIPALENVALWHERDISHSSVERVIAPDATIALDFALHRMADLIENLTIKPDAMTANLNRLGGVIYSERVLLRLTASGVPREDAYRMVQRNAMRALRDEGTMLELLQGDADVTAAVPAAELAALFEPESQLQHVDTIFERVFGRGRP